MCTYMCIYNTITEHMTISGHGFHTLSAKFPLDCVSLEIWDLILCNRVHFNKATIDTNVLCFTTNF